MSGDGLRVALLLHFHQPHYVDEVEGSALLPWVRLHAVKGYYDIPWILERFGDLRLTLNVTPVLLLQLAGYVSGRVTDLFERVARIPPRDLTLAERRFVVRNFFSIQLPRVRELPRYWELFQRKAPFHDEPERGAARFTDAELGDLQCLFNLAWTGFGVRADEPFVAELLARGRDYSQEDRERLLDLHREIAGRALAKLRELAAAGRVEISTSPLFHPILPLLHDTEIARRVNHGRPAPPRFTHPEDVALHLRPAAGFVERVLGVRPSGLWPSEGSVAPEILPAVREAGFRWLATDEHILLQSLPPGAHPRAALYRPYRAEGLAVVFRDRQLADRISFDYAHWPAEAAVGDFTGRLRAVGSLTRGTPALVTVAFDGENPWESYSDGGRGFLEGLAAALGKNGTPPSSTVGQALAELPEPESLDRFGSGSWIRGTFEIWAGKPQKNAAWGVLARTRERFPGSFDHEALWDEGELGRRLRSLAAAEGSDWFWWYDDDFFSLHKDLFDYLFRRHQANALDPSGLEEPRYLRRTLLPPAEGAGAHEPIRTLVRPRVDGEVTDFYEWDGAGRYRAPLLDPLLRTRDPALEGFRYGFDEEMLYLRYDYGEVSGAGLEVVWRIDFGTPLRVAHPFRGADASTALLDPLARIAQASICELALPRAALGAMAGAEGTIELGLHRNGREIEAHPPLAALAVAVPDPRTIASLWVT